MSLGVHLADVEGLRRDIAMAKAEIAAGHYRLLPYLEGWTLRLDRIIQEYGNVRPKDTETKP